MDAKNMCDTQLLVGYLYDEIEPASRRALEAHLASCAECRGDVAALRLTRRQLAEWTPPEQQAGFQIVSRAAPPARSAFLKFSPAWGLAAAAVLVLAAAAAIANVEVRYGADSMTIRTGWGGAPAAAVQGDQKSVSPASVTADLETVQRRLDQLEAARSQPQPVALQTASRVSDADMLRRVSALLSESETRQNRELALRIRQLATEMEAQRRVDLATIQQGLQGATAAEAATHQQLWNYAQGLYRVSQQSQSK